MKTLGPLACVAVFFLMVLTPCVAQKSGSGSLFGANASGTMFFHSGLDVIINSQLGITGTLNLSDGGVLNVGTGWGSATLNGGSTRIDGGALTLNDDGTIMLNGSGTTVISGSDGTVVDLFAPVIDTPRMDFQLENQMYMLNARIPRVISGTTSLGIGGGTLGGRWVTFDPSGTSSAAFPTFLADPYEYYFRWEVSKNNGASWINIGASAGDELIYSSGTENPLVINALKTEMSGWKYRLISDQVYQSGTIINRTSEPVSFNIKPSYIKGPKALAIDTSNNLYVADPLTNAIWKIFDGNKAGVFAGSSAGEAGTINATGTNARFNRPAGLAFHSGKLYVADTGNNAIRVVAPDGSVSLLAGGAGQAGDYKEGIGAAARFDKPTALTVDASGNIYVIDSGNNMVRKITPAGVTSHIAGDRFPWGSAVKLPVFVSYSDENNATNDYSDWVGLTVTTNRGAPAGGQYPWATGNMIFSKNTTIIPGFTLAQSTTLGIDERGSFGGIASTSDGRTAYLSGNLYYNSRSLLYSAPFSWEQPLQSQSYYFNTAAGITLTPDGKSLYVANTGNGHICKIDLATRAIIGRFEVELDDKWANTLWELQGIRFDKNGHLLVAESANSVILKFPPSGRGTEVAGIMNPLYFLRGLPMTAGSGATIYLNSFADGAVDTALFESPTDLALDSAGNIYVADTENAAIRKITQSGTGATVSTLILEAAPVQYSSGTTATPPAGNGGSGNTGGGGALSAWCLLAFGVLGVLRLRRR